MDKDTKIEMKKVKAEQKSAKIAQDLKNFKKAEGVAATFEEDEPGDVALLGLAKKPWFRIFIIISVALAFSEPFLVAFPSTLLAQKIVLAVSSFLFLFGYVANDNDAFRIFF